MYEQRDFILENDDVHEVVQQMFKRVISDRVSACTNFDTKSQDVDAEALIKGLNEIGFKDLVNVEELSGKNREDISSYVYEKAWEYYEQKVEPVKDKIRSVEKEVSLRTIDRAWSNHIDTMDKLRNGIGLRGYAQSNPLQAYVQEGYQLFEDMMATISQEIVSFCMNVRVVPVNEANKEA